MKTGLLLLLVLLVGCNRPQKPAVLTYHITAQPVTGAGTLGPSFRAPKTWEVYNCIAARDAFDGAEPGDIINMHGLINCPKDLMFIELIPAGWETRQFQCPVGGGLCWPMEVEN